MAVLAKSDGPITMQDMQQAVSNLMDDIPEYLATERITRLRPGLIIEWTNNATWN